MSDFSQVSGSDFPGDPFLGRCFKSLGQFLPEYLIVWEEEGPDLPVASEFFLIFSLCFVFSVAAQVLRINHGLLTSALFEFLTDSHLLLPRLRLTCLPASHVAGAIHPLRLNQRSSATSPPPCFGYRIHKQTHKDMIEVRESSQSELAGWHAHTHPHKNTCGCWIL